MTTAVLNCAVGSTTARARSSHGVLGPHALDAWRIDVANMTGIRGDINLSHEVATTIRRTMVQVTSESFLQAESNHDASRDLLGDGYQGTMNYAAFTRPLWQWLLPQQPQPYAPRQVPRAAQPSGKSDCQGDARVVRGHSLAGHTARDEPHWFP